MLIIIKIHIIFFLKLNKFEVSFFCLVLEIVTHNMTSLHSDKNTLQKPGYLTVTVIQNYTSKPGV